MKVLILAAGTSSRLRPLTEQVPKTLLELSEDLKMLDHILDNCYQHGLKDFYLVTGHGHEHVKKNLEDFSDNKKNVNYELVYNPEYATKGNIYSFYLGHNAIDGDYILIHSDVIFHPDILKYIIEHPEKNVMAVDDTKKLSEEEMKVYVDDNKRVNKIHKTLDPADSHGEHIGVSKISGDIKNDLTKSIEDVLSKDEQVFYEDSIQHLIDNKKVPFHSASTKGLPAMEIDTHEDLAEAKEMITKI